MPVNGGNSPKNPNNFPAPDNDLANPGQGDFYSAPIWSLPHSLGVGASLTGGEVYRGDMFPEASGTASISTATIPATSSAT